MTNITLEEVKTMDREMLTPAIVAEVIGCNPQSIRIAARTEPLSLGFPTSCHGSRVQIPRRPFVAFLESGGPWFSRDRK